MRRRTFLASTLAALPLSLLLPKASAKRRVVFPPFESHYPRWAPRAPGMRQVQVRADNGIWVPCSWPGLQRGDIFRLHEPDGSIADEGTDHEVNVALGPAEWTVEEVWRVDSVPFTRIDMDHPLAGRVQIYDREGQRLGFVRFLDVLNGTAMCVGLDRSAVGVGLDRSHWPSIFVTRMVWDVGRIAVDLA